MRRNERQDSSHYRNSDLQRRHDKVLRACTVNHLDWGKIAFDRGIMLPIEAAEVNIARALLAIANNQRAIAEQEILAAIVAGLDETDF